MPPSAGAYSSLETQEKVAGLPRAATAVATTTSGSSAETASEGSPAPSASDGEASVSALKESSQALPSRRGHPTRPSDGAEQKVVGAAARRRRSDAGEAHGCGGEEMKRTGRRGRCELAWPSGWREEKEEEAAATATDMAMARGGVNRAADEVNKCDLEP